MANTDRPDHDAAAGRHVPPPPVSPPPPTPPLSTPPPITPQERPPQRRRGQASKRAKPAARADRQSANAGPRGSRKSATARTAATTPAAEQPKPRLTLKAAQARRRAKKAAEQPARVDSVDEITAEATPEEDLTDVAIKAAPPWLVSLVFHTLVFIILGLLYVAKLPPPVISLDATYAESIGVQLEDDLLATNSMDPNDVIEPVFSIDTMPADDPLARPPDVEQTLRGRFATDELTAPSVGIALTGRERGMKKALLAAYGGNATTEAAVGRALEWLKRNQGRDGLWSLVGPYSQGAMHENRTAATAMALLAFQGAGHTHQAGKYQDVVRRGWRTLLKQQDRDGNFFPAGGQSDHRLYSQAQVMIALCELYGMTQDSKFKEPAQRTVDYAVEIQAPEGGWRYVPRKDSDTSVTGWFVMGLQSALMAGLEVPSPTLRRVSEFLDSVAMYDGAFYKYQPNRQGFTPAMTAEGLLCRQYLGWKHNDPRLREGVAFLLDNPIDWDNKNSYYWYYATQVVHHMEGDAWDEWNRVMRQTVPENQVRGGVEDGSWEPDGDRWGSYGGRLYHTCLCTYMLEVYYRHLPIYSYRME